MNKKDILFAVLIGSRANSTASDSSDWDIAVAWQYDMLWMERVANTETLRRDLAQAMAVTTECIDVVDLHRAGLTMRAAVADEGIILYGEKTLPWTHFLLRTWRDLEVFYWSDIYAL